MDKGFKVRKDWLNNPAMDSMVDDFEATPLFRLMYEAAEAPFNKRPFVSHAEMLKRVRGSRRKTKAKRVRTGRGG